MNYFYNIHRHNADLLSNEIAVVNNYPKDPIPQTGFFSCGIHPWYIEEQSLTSDLQAIELALKNPSCVALGECGLDNRVETELAKQQPIFEAQLELAKQYQMPVIVHCVGAYAEVLSAKKRLQFKQALVFHGFSKNLALAQQLQNADCYVSFGKYLMTQEHLPAILKELNLQRIFLETDSSDYLISEVYAKAATALQLELIALQELIQNNFQTVFKQEK
ncbi:TatD family hydrolase [Flavobacterium sp.]|uniref:TatD family hydrolase n=1 Tax=Flavobacterium sp. TaxID=239 RepID=UPI003B9D17C9